MDRILHYIGSLNHGGAQSAIMSLYRHIDRHEYQFDFISHYPEENELASEIEELGGRVFFIEPFLGDNIFEFSKAWKRFFSQHEEYQVLHLHMRSTASLVIPCAKKFGLTTIAHSHSTSNGSGITAFVQDILQLPIRNQADYLIGCSTEAANWLFGKKVTKRKNYIYLPNAIDLEEYQFSINNRLTLRSQLGILEDDIVFGHVGRLHESKNHTFLLKVFNELKKRYENSYLILVGDGPLRLSIEESISAYGLDKSVFLLGNRNDVPQLLSAMDVFLFPSIWEGLPVSVVEALAAGLPCYVSDSITRDIDICSDVHRLSIKDSEIWSKSIEIASRVNAKEAIRRKGFDINDSVETLVSIYERAIKKRI